MNHNQFRLLTTDSSHNKPFNTSNSKTTVPLNSYSHNLTNREFEILNLIAYEHTNLEIAKKLHISCHTVDSHRKAMYRKLQVRNTAGLIRRSFELGILTIGMKLAAS